jgi:hypothetical protein
MFQAAVILVRSDTHRVCSGTSINEHRPMHVSGLLVAVQQKRTTAQYCAVYAAAVKPTEDC